jgi:PAS domain S-box-containing protein
MNGEAGRIISEQKQNIFSLWEKRVRSQVPASENVSTLVLIDSLPVFLDHLALLLVSPLDSHKKILHDATLHAVERASIANYTLEQVLLEYRLLRHVLIETLSEFSNQKSLEKETVQTVDECIDDAIAKAAREFLVSEIEILQKRAGISENIKHSTNATPETRMAQSHEGLRLLINAVKDYAIYMMDTSGHVISWNEGARRIKGYSADEILGQHFSIFYTPDARLRKKPEHEMTMALKEGRYEEEGWRVKKDGSLFWADVIISPVYDRPGKLLGFAKITRDLSERRKRDEEIFRLNNELSRQLDERTSELKNILEAVGEGIYGLDADGKLTFMNEAASKMLGWKPAELLGRNVHELIHHSREDRTPYPIEECLIYNSLKDGKHHNTLEDILWRKNGTSFPSEFTSSPIIEDEKIQGAVVVFRDISERKKIMEALMRQQDWLNTILDRIPVPIILVEAVTGNVRFLNESARNYEFQIPKEIHKEEDPVFFAADAHGKRLSFEDMPRMRVARGEDINEVEIIWHTPGGSYHLFLNGRLIPSMYGHEPVGILTFENITERKNYEAQLRQAVSAREDVLGVVSHDLRNPLGAILMSSNLMMMKSPIDEEFAHKTARKIFKAGHRMNEMIEDLLNMAKIESGQFELTKNESCGRELIVEAVELLMPLAQKKHIKIDMPEKSKRFHFECDQVKLLRVFTNLLHNAIKFTPESGHIKLNVVDKDDHYEFSIADSGPGITAQQIPQIFDRFWQAKGTSHLGTGLGLAIAKGIVEAHGGTIWVESQFGHGATFKFNIPKNFAKGAINPMV